MTKASWIVFGIMAGIIAILAIILFNIEREKVGVTVTILGDSTYHAPVASNPVPINSITPAIKKKPQSPIIIYLPDTNGKITVDTNAIKDRYERMMCVMDSIYQQLLTTHIYSDTVNDTAAKVRAIIKDTVSNNILQKNRKVYFMNYRPISMKLVTLGKNNVFSWRGYAFLGSDFMDYQKLLYKISGALELNAWRLTGMIEPEVSIEKRPQLGIQIKVGYRLWGK